MKNNKVTITLVVNSKEKEHEKLQPIAKDIGIKLAKICAEKFPELKPIDSLVECEITTINEGIINWRQLPINYNLPK